MGAMESAVALSVTPRTDSVNPRTNSVNQRTNSVNPRTNGRDSCDQGSQA